MQKLFISKRGLVQYMLTKAALIWSIQQKQWYCEILLQFKFNPFPF